MLILFNVVLLMSILCFWGLSSVNVVSSTVVSVYECSFFPNNMLSFNFSPQFFIVVFSFMFFDLEIVCVLPLFSFLSGGMMSLSVGLFLIIMTLFLISEYWFSMF